MSSSGVRAGHRAERPAGRVDPAIQSPPRVGTSPRSDTAGPPKWAYGQADGSVGSSRKRDLTTGTPQVVMDGPVSAGPSFSYGWPSGRSRVRVKGRRVCRVVSPG